MGNNISKVLVCFSTVTVVIYNVKLNLQGHIISAFEHFVQRTF